MSQIAQAKPKAPEPAANDSLELNQPLSRRLDEGAGRLGGKVEAVVKDAFHGLTKPDTTQHVQRKPELSLDQRRDQASGIMNTSFEVNALLRPETMRAVSNGLQSLSSVQPNLAPAATQAAQAVTGAAPRLAPVAGVASKVGFVGGIAIGVMEFVSTKDKIEGALRGAGVAAGAIAGAELGIQLGLTAGAFTGPVAPIAAPTLAFVGALSGAAVGQWAGRKLGSSAYEIATGHKSELSAAEHKKK